MIISVEIISYSCVIFAKSVTFTRAQINNVLLKQYSHFAGWKANMLLLQTTAGEPGILSRLITVQFDFVPIFSHLNLHERKKKYDGNKSEKEIDSLQRESRDYGFLKKSTMN